VTCDEMCESEDLWTITCRLVDYYLWTRGFEA